MSGRPRKGWPPERSTARTARHRDQRDALRGHAPFPVPPAHVTPTDPGRAAAGDGHERKASPRAAASPSRDPDAAPIAGGPESTRSSISGWMRGSGVEPQPGRQIRPRRVRHASMPIAAKEPTPDAEIQTDRLIVRPFRPDDWRDLFDYLSLPETYAFEPGAPIDAAQARRPGLVAAIEWAAGSCRWCSGRAQDDRPPLSSSPVGARDAVLARPVPRRPSLHPHRVHLRPGMAVRRHRSVARHRRRGQPRCGPHGRDRARARDLRRVPARRADGRRTPPAGRLEAPHRRCRRWPRRSSSLLFITPWTLPGLAIDAVLLWATLVRGWRPTRFLGAPATPRPPVRRQCGDRAQSTPTHAFRRRRTSHRP